MADSGYAKPVLSTRRLVEHLGDDDLVVAEVDENPDLYDEGHIPGAVKLHWRDDLQDPVERDIVGKAEFERLLGERGIGNETTVVLYGDNNNWFAAFAFWTAGVWPRRRRDGWGPSEVDRRGARTDERRAAVAPTTYFAQDADRDDPLRAPRRGARDSSAPTVIALVDVRSPEEYSGELIAPPGYEQEGAQRAGHIPGAGIDPVGAGGVRGRHVQAAVELRALYDGKGVTRNGGDRLLPHR